MTKNKRKNNKLTILLAFIIVFAFIILTVSLLFHLDVISFTKEEVTNVPSVVGNILPEKIAEFYEALPREEYAKALGDITIPEEYYSRYSISIFSGEKVRKTDYIAIYRGGDWWVQSSENDVILSTAICVGDAVKISDNTDNTSIVDASGEIEFSEYSGFMPLSTLTEIIYSLSQNESVDYAGGISDFSLSYTQARGTGENIFAFTFTRADGIKEEYTFAFESATILSVVRYLPSGEKIYQMEMKDSRNDISAIDVNSLLVID